MARLSSLGLYEAFTDRQHTDTATRSSRSTGSGPSSQQLNRSPE